MKHHRALRDDQKQVRRQALIDIAWQLFQANSYPAITMAEVAERAGLAKGTLYLYFRTKEELFLAMQQQFATWFDDLDTQLANTQAYVLSLSEALAEELRGTGVRVTALCPGPTRLGFQQRAKMEQSRLVQGKIMDVDSVACAGYTGLISNQRIVIPGWQNKLLAFTTRLLPRNLVTRLARQAQERVHAPA